MAQLALNHQPVDAWCQGYLAVLGDDAEGVVLQEAVEEAEDVRVVEPREELGLLGRLHRLVGPEVTQGDFFQNLPGGGHKCYTENIVGL